jgi:5-methylcytosine-specific restriction endonuclease McrA
MANESGVVGAVEHSQNRDVVQAAGKKPDDRVTSKAILDLLRRQSFRCAMTGRMLTPDVASIDHIIPVSKGGEHRLSNVQVLHADVNAAKQTMSVEDFISLCREVVIYADSKGA